MLYLGLGPDEEYDEYDGPDQPVRREAAERSNTGSRYPVASRGAGHETGDVQVTGSVRTLTPQPVDPISDRSPSPGIGTVGAAAKPRGAVVRPIPIMASAKPYIVSPTSFNEAQQVADNYKANTPVIVNLQSVDRDLSRRLIDFASGLCYGLGGTMEKVANQVYLLTPSNVEVSAEERRRLERGLYD